jgi:hypothetical protein
MQTATQMAPVSKGQKWTGIALTVLISLMLLMGVAMGLSGNAQAVQGFTQYGYPAAALKWVVLAELLCVVLYAIPRTAVFGAILLTGYLGGAVATHVRAAELDKFLVPVVVCAVAWLGIWLREPRLQALTPLRK